MTIDQTKIIEALEHIICQTGFLRAGGCYSGDLEGLEAGLEAAVESASNARPLLRQFIAESAAKDVKIASLEDERAQLWREKREQLGACEVKFATKDARIAELEATVRIAALQISSLSREAGEAKGRLEASELAGVVEGWINRAESAERALAEMTKERDRLIEDRARFPDRPDDIGCMIECHFENIKRGKEAADSHARNAMMKLLTVNDELAEELGCENDNEAILEAIDTLKTDRDYARGLVRADSDAREKVYAELTAARAEVERLREALEAARVFVNAEFLRRAAGDDESYDDDEQAIPLLTKIDAALATKTEGK